jgi:hypothetical protein
MPARPELAEASGAQSPAHGIVNLLRDARDECIERQNWPASQQPYERAARPRSRAVLVVCMLHRRSTFRLHTRAACLVGAAPGTMVGLEPCDRPRRFSDSGASRS